MSAADGGRQVSRLSGPILVLNAGSSSLKFAVFVSGDAGLDLAWKGRIEGIGTAPRLVLESARRQILADQALALDVAGTHAACLKHLRALLNERLDGAPLQGVGHRVVHGGPDFERPARIDGAILERLDRLVPLAPLHQPHNLAAIRALAGLDPELPQVACFDTAFHRSRPRVADLFALPFELYEAGIRRYGFHGLSYEWIAHRLPEVAPEIAPGRVVIAHLGSGVSLCAIRDGRAVDSSMAFTPLDGVPMGTRPGALDPGVVLHLIQARGQSAEQVSDLLYHRSGLLGLSGLSNDMRDLLASAEPRAALAVEHFVYRVAQTIAALAASLGGLDGLVFTAGIGERSPDIRARVCEASAWLGLELDPGANARGGPRLTRPGSPVSAWVIPTDEERVIAEHTAALLTRKRSATRSIDHPEG